MQNGSKRLMVGLVTLGLALGCVVSADAATLTWDRNADTDMQDYQVWACFTPNCVVVKSATTLQPGTVVQPAAGIRPSYVIDIDGREGAVAVSARDRSLNETGLSVPLPFDRVPPTTPVNLRFQ